jgi:hypothetical protein
MQKKCFVELSKIYIIQHVELLKMVEAFAIKLGHIYMGDTSLSSKPQDL